MIVRQFLFWLRSAPAGERAEATAALARAYLYSDLSNDDLAAAEGAMTMLLDDPSPLVRAAMADVLAASEYAPPSVIHVLAGDQPEISSIILERSPLLLDAELVDAVATHGPIAQSAIARRANLPRSVAAAIAEVGTAEACLELLENPGADIAPFSIDRMVDRFGHLAPIREELLLRADLPASVRQALVAKLSKTLAEFVIAREWLFEERAHRVAKEACEKATVALASSTSDDDVRPLIRHLRESGQLTAGLILRALLSGNMAMFEEALAELSGLSLARVSALIHDRGAAGLRALYNKAGLPALAYPAFREAIATLQEDGFLGDPVGTARLKRRMVERVLTRCAGLDSRDIEPLMMLLRRFATEAAREEARMFCDDIVDGMMAENAAREEYAAWQDAAAAYGYADSGYADNGYADSGYADRDACYEHADHDARHDAAHFGETTQYAQYAHATAYEPTYHAAAYDAAQTDDAVDVEGYVEHATVDDATFADAPSADWHAGYRGTESEYAAYGDDSTDPTADPVTLEAGSWDEVFPEYDATNDGRVEYSNTNDQLTFDEVWDGVRYPAADNTVVDNSRYAA